MMSKMYVGPNQELIDNREKLEKVFDKWMSKHNDKYRFVSRLEKRGLILVLIKKGKEKIKKDEE